MGRMAIRLPNCAREHIETASTRARNASQYVEWAKPLMRHSDGQVYLAEIGQALAEIQTELTLIPVVTLDAWRMSGREEPPRAA